MGTVRWGIAGPGRIAEAVAPDFMHVPHAELVAVGSRDEERAAAFAARHGLKRAHGSYRALVDDPEVDAIYIATPHPMHHALAMAAIEAGKAVLVEKAFTATLAGTLDVINAAETKGVFCMEGMWTRFQPAVKAAREVIAWGRIGEVVGVQGDLAAFRRYNEADRLFAPELGGGATLDLGVYVMCFTHDFLGRPNSIKATGRRYPNGVDAAASVSLGYASGATASLTYALDSHGPGRMVIFGTNGWIEVEPRFHHPTTISVHRSGVLPRIIETPVVGRGYSHELIEATECILAGRTESDVMPLQATLEVAEMMDAVLTQLGLSYTEAELEL